jgi:hypothetical protein
MIGEKASAWVQTRRNESREGTMVRYWWATNSFGRTD